MPIGPARPVERLAARPLPKRDGPMRKSPPPKPRDATDFDGAGLIQVFPFLPTPSWYYEYWYERPPHSVAKRAARFLDSAANRLLKAADNVARALRHHRGAPIALR
jgi:hypothetical protein